MVSGKRKSKTFKGMSKKKRYKGRGGNGFWRGGKPLKAEGRVASSQGNMGEGFSGKGKGGRPYLRRAAKGQKRWHRIV